MPKLIDWGVRYELIREAVVRVAAREGASGVSFPAVAAEMRTSVSTLRRTLDSPEALPQMGASLLARLRRQKRYMRGCPRGARRGSVEHLAWVFRVEIPVDEADLESQRAWVQLTGVGASEACAELRRQDEDYLDALVRGALQQLSAEQAAPAQHAIRLRALLDGLIAARCRETVSADDALDCLYTFLCELAPPPAEGVTLAGA